MKRGYVYFIRVEYGERPVKIGHTRHPLSRLGWLRPWSPWPLTFVAVFECADPEKEERAIHRRLAALRLHGEWFVGDGVSREILQLSQRLKKVDGEAKDLRAKRARAVTVRLRIGYSTTGALVGEVWNKKRKKYGGRGWKQSLVDDGVAHLREVLA